MGMARYSRRDYEFVADVLHAERDFTLGNRDIDPDGLTTDAIDQLVVRFAGAFTDVRGEDQDRESVLANQVGRDERVLPYFDWTKFINRAHDGHKCGNPVHKATELAGRKSSQH